MKKYKKLLKKYQKLSKRVKVLEEELEFIHECGCNHHNEKLNFDFLIGKSIEEATEYIKDTPYNIAVIKVDGVEQAIDEKINYYRIQVIVENGVITAVNDVQ